jgi:hypothetical protein
MNSQRSLRIAITVVLAIAGCAHDNTGGGTGGTGANAGGGGQAGGTTGAGNSTGSAGSVGSGSAGTNGGGHAGTNSPAGGSSGQTGTTGAAGSAAGGTSGTGGGTSGGASGHAGGTSGQTGSGGRAGGTSGQAGGTSGGAGGTTVAAGTCLDNVMNGTETGVDCGGSCPACPSYQINQPNLKNMAQSGCGNGGTGFMCTRSMAFSPEFKQAAHDDAVANGWNASNPPFVYGVVGHDKDSGGLDTQSGNTCCQCYQLVFVSPNDPVSGLPVPKPMIVQAFNTAAGGAMNFDIYMAKGGEGGNTNGCSALYTTFPTVGEPNNGGIRPVNFPTQCATSTNMYSQTTVASSTCQQQIASQCNMITSTMSASIQSTSQQSCIEANQPANLYHLNWKVRAERVECPVNLTRVTGCKLKSQGLPQPDPTAQDSSTAGSGFLTGSGNGYGTTTMQDCCRPTCAYQSTNNVDPNTADSQYAIFYTCDKSGNVQ